MQNIIHISVLPATILFSSCLFILLTIFCSGFFAFISHRRGLILELRVILVYLTAWHPIYLFKLL